ncbi:glutaminase 2 [Escherichia coli]|nr:glutaminase 2 [Escherichia coli]
MAVAMDNAILENILRQVRPLIGQGKVADYIPALATVDGSRLGIAICTVDGQLFQAGDAQERFSIQSISKVLSLVVAMRHYSEEEIWQRVCNFAFFSGLIDAQFWAGIAQLKSPELTAKIYLFSSGLSPRPFLAHPLTKNYPVVLSE